MRRTAPPCKEMWLEAGAMLARSRKICNRFSDLQAPHIVTFRRAASDLIGACDQHGYNIIVTGRISDNCLRPGGRHLKVLLPNEHEIEVSHPLYSYAPLALEVGEPVRLALRREALMLLV